MGPQKRTRPPHRRQSDALDNIRRALKYAEDASTSALADIAVHDDRYPNRQLPSGKITNLPSRPSKRSGLSGISQTREITRLLDKFVEKRFDAQKRLHEGMIGACMRLIFRNCKDIDIKTALIEMGIRKTKQQFFAVTPRRFGKTYAVSMMVAALVLACPDITIAIFSTGKRASELLLKQVLEFIRLIPGAEERIDSCNSECLTIRHGSTVTKLNSYPGTARTYLPPLILLPFIRADYVIAVSGCAGSGPMCSSSRRPLSSQRICGRRWWHHWLS